MAAFNWKTSTQMLTTTPNITKKQIAAPLKFKDFGPFSGFFNNDRGLRSLQPTLLWRISFGNYSEILFTDKITVPGEQISIQNADSNYNGDIPFYIGDRRQTTNKISIGIYVDVYHTIEEFILPDIIEFSKDGNKAKFKQLIDLYGYQMGNPDGVFFPVKTLDQEDLTISEFDSKSMYENLIKSNESNVSNNEDQERPCLIHYSFIGCIPIGIDEYTYDHLNQKWANVRMVNFAFEDYTIEYQDKIKIQTGTGLAIDKNTNLSMYANRNVRKDKNKSFYFEPNTNIVFDAGTQDPTTLDKIVATKEFSEEAAYKSGVGGTKTIVGADGKTIGVLKNIKAKQPSYYWLPNATGKESLLAVSDPDDPNNRLPARNFVINNSSTGTKMNEHELGVIYVNKRDVKDAFPENDRPRRRFKAPGAKESMADKNTAPKDLAAMSSGWFVEPVMTRDKNKFLTEIPDELKTPTSGDKPIQMGAYMYDTPMPSWQKEGLITTIIKTAVRKFLIPDTPSYHGYMKGVSRAIRQVQQLFYTEPIKKTSPEDDHLTEVTHADINKYTIPYADHIINHGPADTLKIDQNDFTTQIDHGTPKLANVDPNDYTTLENHGTPKLENVDPYDYTTLENHGSPDLMPIDPNDHTTLDNHGMPNLENIDPNDFVTNQNHGSPDIANIDPNDYTTNNGHGTTDLVSIDPNDRPEQTTAVGNQVSIDENDYPTSENMSYDNVGIDTNDTVDPSDIDPDVKAIDVNDTVDTSGLKANEKTIDPNDTVDSSGLSVNDVGIDEDDTPNASTVKYDDVEPDVDDTVQHAVDIAFDLIKTPPNDAVGQHIKTTEIKSVRTSIDDTPNKFKRDQKSTIVIERNDVVSKHSSPELVNSNPNDKLTRHAVDNKSILSTDADDTPKNLQKLSIGKVGTEMSIMDFAKMIVNERKNDQSSTMRFDPIVEKRATDGKIKSHTKEFEKIVDRPTDPQSVNTDKIKTDMNIVNVHGDDHTEIVQ